jgi:hypothetical protein
MKSDPEELVIGDLDVASILSAPVLNFNLDIALTDAIKGELLSKLGAQMEKQFSLDLSIPPIAYEGEKATEHTNVEAASADVLFQIANPQFKEPEFDASGMVNFLVQQSYGVVKPKPQGDMVFYHEPVLHGSSEKPAHADHVHATPTPSWKFLTEYEGLGQESKPKDHDSEIAERIGLSFDPALLGG